MTHMNMTLLKRTQSAVVWAYLILHLSLAVILFGGDDKLGKYPTYRREFLLKLGVSKLGPDATGVWELDAPKALRAKGARVVYRQAVEAWDAPNAAKYFSMSPNGLIVEFSRSYTLLEEIRTLKIIIQFDEDGTPTSLTLAEAIISS